MATENKQKNSEIPEGWTRTILGEFLILQRGFDLPATDRHDGQYPLMVSNGQDGFHKEYKVKAPGVVTGRSGSLGSVFYVEKNFWPLNTTLWVKDFYDNNVKFAYYLLKNLPLDKYNSGSGVPTLNRNHVHPLDIIVPGKNEQKTIADVLSSLDNKIELLREQNETLEKTAQTIFNEWFGRYKVGDELPEGWKAGKLTEIAKFLNGLAMQKFPVRTGEESLPVIKIRELKQGISGQTGKSNLEVPHEYHISNGDVLFSWSGSLEVVIWQYGKGALNQHLFKVSSDVYPKWFYYSWVLHHLKEFQAVAATKATTMGHINRNHLESAEVIIPDSDTLTSMSALMEPLLNKFEINSQEILSLSKTRDLLLPKLMTGKISVKI
jgi:type I restriction enzyme S subunit